MTRSRLLIFPLASLAALFALVAFSLPTFATTSPEVLSVHYVFTFDVADHAPMAVIDLAVVVDPVAILPDVVRGASLVDVRSLGDLKPEYAEALATDALNFIDVRMRC